MYSLKNCWITEFNLLSNLLGRDLEFKQFQNPKPLLIRDSQLINPSSSKIGKGISASATPVSFPAQSVNFIAPTPYAETTVVFPTQLYEKQPCSIFAPDKDFKVFYSRLHHYKWCQMFYNYQDKFYRTCEIFSCLLRGFNNRDNNIIKSCIFNSLPKFRMCPLHINIINMKGK